MNHLRRHKPCVRIVVRLELRMVDLVVGRVRIRAVHRVRWARLERVRHVDLRRVVRRVHHVRIRYLRRLIGDLHVRIRLLRIVRSRIGACIRIVVLAGLLAVRTLAAGRLATGLLWWRRLIHVHRLARVGRRARLTVVHDCTGVLRKLSIWHGGS